MRLSILLAVIVAAAAATSPAHAQSGPTNHRAVIAGQLDHAARTKGEEGFRVEDVNDPQSVIGLLPKQGAVILEVNLRAGVEYFVFAGCDTDCDDLDLRLNAPGESEPMASDVADDDVPILSFTAKQAGPHLLTVRMTSCNADLCYFGYQVLAKR